MINFTDPICNHYPTTANTDVAGIGLFISYLMQLCIVFAAWLYSNLLTSWAKAITFIISRPTGAVTAKERVESVQIRLDRTTQYAALLSGLVEYQKSLAYFAITMQGAAMIALGGTALSSVRSHTKKSPSLWLHWGTWPLQASRASHSGFTYSTKESRDLGTSQRFLCWRSGYRSSHGSKLGHLFVI